MQMRSLVIVGNGMVGQRLVDDLVGIGGLDHWDVTVVGDEPVGAYDRVALSSYFDGASLDDLNLCDLDRLSNAGVEFRFGVRVEQIDRGARNLALSDGTALRYDELVLATGSTPFVPPLPGTDLPGVFVYRTIDDLERIHGWSTSCSTGVVIGGGLLGLEAANALSNLGLTAHVIEMADRLMPQQLDPAASAMLRKWIDELGVESHLGFATSAIEGTPDGVTHVAGADDESVPADIVLVSAGIRPRDELGRSAGLDLGPRGGIAVDDYLRTSDPHISALGEVASHDERIYGLVGPGYQMASILAARLCDRDAEPFLGADLSTKLKLFGVDVASFGDTALDDDRDHLVFSDPVGKVHRRLSMRDGQVVGGVLVGDTTNYDALLAMSTATMATPDDVASLVPPAGADTGVVLELPDSALICSCNGVSRGDIRAAVDAGSRCTADVAACTNAGTGCGGCVPGVAALIDEQLVSLGVEVDNSLCEHFAYTRQELFDLVRVHRHHTWADVLGNHGTGRGCDICRPAVASILASLSNGYILDGDQACLQDTNDFSLANMQKNGTYSVVPRVPGGEITPAQLIALGEIANEFGLYTKITGGQRIDLLGAQLHELPLIWDRVIAAGMESGHAYGKALRTVKSCVGDMWCRYGVQDAVAMAIRLELRYRGLRSPHKLKSAVSGCTRECAEAQSKDFGVIATETGWNLYLGGNGGRVPRHGDLFATDLDDEELIRVIDRFLMFYIRTADRLERTSTWLSTLDGGVEYLRTVIVDDSLGICEELDADLARHIESYECEWTATLADDRRLEHFIEFANAPDQHSQPVWVHRRGQRVPQ